MRPESVKQADIVVMTNEQSTAEQVRATLESSVRGQLVHVCATMNELRAYLSSEAARTHFSVALVDMDQDAQQVLHELGRISALFSHATYVVLSHDFDEQRVLQAMQAGARHFLRKNTIAQELDTVLERLLIYHRQIARKQGVGQVISVLSCQGGCGATTVALNLAAELQLATGNRVLIIDLDRHYGAMASFLNVESDYGIAHLLKRADALDEPLVESVIVKAREGLDLLLSPASTTKEEDQMFDLHQLLPVLEFCQNMYEYIVIDAPRLNRQNTLALTAVSRLIVLVFQLTLPGVRFAQARVKDLKEQGMPPERIYPLANRVRRFRTNAMVTLDDAHRVLGVDALMTVRSDWNKAIKSLHGGQPLAYAAQQSGLRRDFRKCCAKIQAGMAGK